MGNFSHMDSWAVTSHPPSQREPLMRWVEEACQFVLLYKHI